ncbi:cobalamin biosynthesis protein [Chitinibacter bivalviorum]|uniref:Cobalamin biosynthesis protein CobD n=1 Tax=Chitinibacter bivalviorum TaxID=2739434 RepID=A0A7H9BFN5_9NEIS|nr:adenosylcobinamide-phosphate synthase CbiB [Chitinibacter bivalviorum]QLG87439.1 cobalamin biosynthesis protein [Chitinibacter bivalviorum]
MLLCFHPLTLLLALAIALVLEWCVGEPRRFHPLVGFGRWVKRMEQQFNIGRMGIALGAFSVLILLAIPLVIFLAVEQIVTQLTDHHAVLQLALLALLHGMALWFALGANSLFRHVDAIAKPLIAQDLPAARYALSMIVSRDCTQLSETDIAKGAIESTLENGADAIFSTLFWFVLLGGVGAIVHRLANTLDAMWGYRTERLIYFGRCAARLDDVLNFIPARLTAASYAVLGDTRLAWQAWREQAPLWDSPNAGPVMAAGAGALRLTLGGNAIYHGRIELRTWLGFGPAPLAADIERSIDLVKKTLALWLVCLLALPLLTIAMSF